MTPLCRGPRQLPPNATWKGKTTSFFEVAERKRKQTNKNDSDGVRTRGLGNTEPDPGAAFRRDPPSSDCGIGNQELRAPPTAGTSQHNVIAIHGACFHVVTMPGLHSCIICGRFAHVILTVNLPGLYDFCPHFWSSIKIKFPKREARIAKQILLILRQLPPASSESVPV